MKSSVSVQPVKHTLVTEILDNGTYTPESGLWCRLYNRLMSMSVDDLKALRMLVYLKMDRAIRHGCRDEKKSIAGTARHCPVCNADMEQFGINEKPKRECTQCGWQESAP